MSRPGGEEEEGYLAGSLRMNCPFQSVQSSAGSAGAGAARTNSKLQGSEDQQGPPPLFTWSAGTFPFGQSSIPCFSLDLKAILFL